MFQATDAEKDDDGDLGEKDEEVDLGLIHRRLTKLQYRSKNHFLADVSLLCALLTQPRYSFLI
jgi:hypothetical protein